MIHELKTWPDPFAAILDGRKAFEVRKADRPFMVGDTLHLREWNPNGSGYTGRETAVVVTYLVSPGAWGLPPDLCVMGFGSPPSPPETPASEGATTPDPKTLDDLISAAVDLGSCKEGAESECYMRHLDDVNLLRAKLAGIDPPAILLASPASASSPGRGPTVCPVCNGTAAVADKEGRFYDCTGPNCSRGFIRAPASAPTGPATKEQS